MQVRLLWKNSQQKHVYPFFSHICAIIPQVQQVVAGGVNHERKVRAASETGLHLTDGQSNLRASATESRLPDLFG